MKIAVCVSHVPDTTSKIIVGQDGKNIDPNGLTFIINPYDEFAVEEALKTKEKFGGDIFVICIGNDSAKDTIRKALAMGCDEGILLKSDYLLDSFATAKLLSSEIKNLNCELVFMGKQSVYYDNGIVGQMTAEFINYSCISNCVSFSLNDNIILAEREIEGGREVLQSKLPIVITTQKGLNEPRYASLKGIMVAKKKTIIEKIIESDESASELIKLKLPEPKKPGRILGEDKSAVAELVRLLSDEAKVIWGKLWAIKYLYS